MAHGEHNHAPRHQPSGRSFRFAQALPGTALLLVLVASGVGIWHLAGGNSSDDSSDGNSPGRLLADGGLARLCAADDPRPTLAAEVATTGGTSAAAAVLRLRCVDEAGRPLAHVRAWVQLSGAGRIILVPDTASAEAGGHVLRTPVPLALGAVELEAVDRSTGTSALLTLDHEGPRPVTIEFEVEHRKLQVLLVDGDGDEVEVPARVRLDSHIADASDPLLDGAGPALFGLSRIAAAPPARLAVDSGSGGMLVSGPRFSVRVPTLARTHLTIEAEGHAPWHRWLPPGDTMNPLVVRLAPANTQRVRVSLGGKPVGRGYRMRAYATRMTRPDWGGWSDRHGMVQMAGFPDTPIPVFLLYERRAPYPISWWSPARDGSDLGAFFEALGSRRGASIDFPDDIGDVETWQLEAVPANHQGLRCWLMWGGGQSAETPRSSLFALDSLLGSPGRPTVTAPAFLFRAPFQFRLARPHAGLRLSADVEMQRLVAEARALVGFVSNREQQAVAGATVSWLAGEDGASYVTERQERTQTDHAGHFSLPTGRHQAGHLLVRAPSFRTARVEIAPGDLGPIAITLEPATVAIIETVQMDPDLEVAATLEVSGPGLTVERGRPVLGRSFLLSLPAGPGRYELAYTTPWCRLDLGTHALKVGRNPTLRLPALRRHPFSSAPHLAGHIVCVEFQSAESHLPCSCYARLGVTDGHVWLPEGRGTVRARVTEEGGRLLRPRLGAVSNWSWEGPASEFPRDVGFSSRRLIIRGANEEVVLRLRVGSTWRRLAVPPHEVLDVDVSSTERIYMEPVGGLGMPISASMQQIDLGRLLDAFPLAPSDTITNRAAGRSYTIRRSTGPRAGEVLTTPTDTHLLALRGANEAALLQVEGTDESWPVQIRVRRNVAEIRPR